MCSSSTLPKVWVTNINSTVYWVLLLADTLVRKNHTMIPSLYHHCVLLAQLVNSKEEPEFFRVNLFTRPLLVNSSPLLPPLYLVCPETLISFSSCSHQRLPTLQFRHGHQKEIIVIYWPSFSSSLSSYSGSQEPYISLVKVQHFQKKEEEIFIWNHKMLSLNNSLSTLHPKRG